MIRIAGVYLITCVSNNKRYVGSSVNIYERMRQHFYRLRKGTHNNPHLSASYKKHGEHNFTVRPLIYCDPENCVMFEEMAINAIHPEFNVRPAKDGHFGVSDETKNKLRAAFLGKPHPTSDATRAKLSAAGMGHGFSDETRAKISATLKGRKVNRSPEWQAKLTASRWGKFRQKAQSGSRPTGAR